MNYLRFQSSEGEEINYIFLNRDKEFLFKGRTSEFSKGDSLLQAVFLDETQKTHIFKAFGLISGLGLLQSQISPAPPRKFFLPLRLLQKSLPVGASWRR